MLFGVGCTPDQNDDPADTDMAEIVVSPTSFATDLEGGEQVITVTSNAAWTVSCDQTDVTIEPLMGTGNGTVTVTVPAAAQREFKVVFDAQKKTTIPALGTSTTTTAKAEVAVSQNAGGVNLDDYLFYEDCGEDVEKNSEGYWPYVDAFEGWNPQGDAATGVAYKGTQASVRASGNAYQPTTDAVGVSGQPYVFLNKVPASAYFVIENIAVTGGKNYIFTYNVQCQNGYSGSPTFATVDDTLVHLELGYDGVNWDQVECTYTPNGGNGWYAVQTEFKVAADATKLYARFTYEAPASNGGGRFDDFKLVAGGNGAELEVSAPEAPTTQEGTIASITTTGNFSVKNAWVIATYAQGFLMTDSSNAVLLVYQGTGANIPAVGQVVNVAGTVSTYAGFLQFAKDGLTVETTGETKTVTNPTPEVMSGSALDAWLKSASIKYVEYVGQLTISGNYYNVTVPGASTAIGSVQYPADAIKTTLDGLSGKYIKVTGWLIGYSQSKYTNTMATAIVETEAPETPETPETPEGGETPVDGDFFSDDAFVDSSQNYNAQANVNGSATVNSSGFKLGTSKLAGYFESKALGVEGDKVLEFYAVAWKDKSATLYVRKKGTTELLGQFTLKANDGATGNPPYLSITLTESDYYTVNVPGVTADTVLEFSTDASFAKVDNTTSGRAIVFGAHIK